jgi:hypothetical protein
MILQKRNVSDKICRENQNTFYVQKLFWDIVPFVRYVEKYATAEQAKDDTIRRMRSAC